MDFLLDLGVLEDLTEDIKVSGLWDLDEDIKKFSVSVVEENYFSNPYLYSSSSSSKSLSSSDEKL